MMASKTILSSTVNSSRRSFLTLAGQSAGASGYSTRAWSIHRANTAIAGAGALNVRGLPALTLNVSALAGRRPLIASRMYSTELDIDDYHELSDEALEYITDQYEELAEKIPEVDADLSHGVLTLVLPPHGTYVINKQPPNKQIWLASPLSGPKRYDYIDHKWVYSRDQSTLGDLLREETKLVTDKLGIDAPEFEELD